MSISSLKKKTVLVLGAGKTGIATSYFLINKAGKILLSDCGKEPLDLKEKIQSLSKSGIEIEFNRNSNEFISQADLVIISPGIAPNSEVVQKINSYKIPLISEIELASYFTNKPIIAVTGTNGKTTTTSLITHIINSSGKKALACGNIGKPLIEAVQEENKVDYFVLETSSFQIYYSPTFSPQFALCLNITPDHLDWHGNLENYIEAKKKLFLQQKNNSWAVLNYADKIIKNFNLRNNLFYFSYDRIDEDVLQNCAFIKGDILKIKTNNQINHIINKKELKILGSHNIENVLASICIAEIINISSKDQYNALRSFQGVEHRLEYVKKVGGKEFYNDSKATNPEATIKAIEALKDKKITLILGGKDKKTTLNQMIDTIKKYVCEVILYGEATARFQEELNKNNFKTLKIVTGLDEAVKTSLNSKTDIVLFSPACSSFDMFKNYEERGTIFKELVCKFQKN